MTSNPTKYPLPAGAQPTAGVVPGDPAHRPKPSENRSQYESAYPADTRRKVAKRGSIAVTGGQAKWPLTCGFTFSALVRRVLPSPSHGRGRGIETLIAHRRTAGQRAYLPAASDIAAEGAAATGAVEATLPTP